MKIGVIQASFVLDRLNQSPPGILGLRQTDKMQDEKLLKYSSVPRTESMLAPSI